MSIRKNVWQIAIRKRNSELLFEDNGKREPFQLIKNSVRYWCADPFLITYGGTRYLFFEMYDRLKRKGVIGYREIKNGKVGNMHKAYECDAHLSYPFAFVHEGELYIIPESNNLKELVLLHGEKVNGKLRFKKEKTLIEGAALADATFIEYEKEIYMFATPVDAKDNTGKLNIYSLNDGRWVPSPLNPIVEDKSKARMGGKFVKTDDGKIIRCSQNCTETYGGGLNFSIVDLDGEYSEQPLLQIAPQDINIKNASNYDGIHTYNYDSEYEVIDLKRNKVFSFVECVGHLLQKLRIIRKPAGDNR